MWKRCVGTDEFAPGTVMKLRNLEAVSVGHMFRQPESGTEEKKNLGEAKGYHMQENNDSKSRCGHHLFTHFPNGLSCEV